MRDPQTASTALEERYRDLGHRHIAGIDEAGRGAWAGPVVAAAVVLPIGDADLRDLLSGVRDSKLIKSMRRRNALADRVRGLALGWGIGQADVDEIAAHNIAGATKLAMRRALDALVGTFPACAPDMLFLDHVRMDGYPLLQHSEARMDSKSLTVAAASLLAKTHRDALMLDLDARYPGYGFAQNKGYGQAAHVAGLDALGVCPAHRLTFKPMLRRLL